CTSRDYPPPSCTSRDYTPRGRTSPSCTSRGCASPSCTSRGCGASPSCTSRGCAPCRPPSSLPATAEKTLRRRREERENAVIHLWKQVPGVRKPDCLRCILPAKEAFFLSEAG